MDNNQMDQGLDQDIFTLVNSVNIVTYCLAMIIVINETTVAQKD